MRSIAFLALALGLVAGSGHAQGPAQGQRRGPPDHWLTIDSIAGAVALTDAQRPEFVKHYDALNAVMKNAAEERRKMVEEMGGARPSPEQMQAMRAKFEFMQTDVDKHYKELRKLLSAEQHGQFDSLPKPQVTMQRQRPGGS